MEQNMYQSWEVKTWQPPKVRPNRVPPLRKGTHLVLTIIPRHSRPLDQFHWTHDGAEVKSRGHRLVFGNSLQIHGVTDADRGSWTCCCSSRGALENHGTYDLEIIDNGGLCKNLFKILAMVLFIAFIIALVLLALICSNYHQLQAKHSQLEHIYNSLQTNYSQLKEGHNRLQTNYSQLEEGLNRLQTNYSQLKEGLNSLQTNYSQLEEGHNSLQTNYSQLEEGCNSLQTNYSQLEEGYNRLQTNYSQLEEGHKILQANYSQLETDYSRQNKSYGQLLVGTRELLNTLIDGCINNTCPWGWSEFNKTCYYFSTELSEWHGANNSCKANNSTLAIVTTESQQDLIARHDTKTRWIGLTDLDQVGDYIWVNGERLGKGFWAMGEANNRGVERCVTKGARFHPSKWNNDLCSARHRWICQTSSFEYLARRFGLEALLRQ
ncbi:uncharacterized protein LOC144486994 [Mustelus asterias]